MLGAISFLGIAGRAKLVPWDSIESGENYFLQLLTQNFLPLQEGLSVRSIGYLFYVSNWICFLTTITLTLMLIPFVSTIALCLYSFKRDWLPLYKSFWSDCLTAIKGIMALFFLTQGFLLLLLN